MGGSQDSYFDGEGFADDGIWLIDVEHGEMRQVFSEPSVSSKFSSVGELFYVLGADGVLHVLDAHDGELIETMGLVEPGEADRPAFIVVGETMYVADPNSGRVMAVHLEEMEIEEEWEVGGAPDEGHDEHEEDRNGHGPLDPHFRFDPIRVKIAVDDDCRGHRGPRPPWPAFTSPSTSICPRVPR